MKKLVRGTLVLFLLVTMSCPFSLVAEAPLIPDSSFLQVLNAPEKKQNVVFILVDDLGWSDLQCYGSDFYETPYIDAFAKTAVSFTDAYAASPLCSPTRASILTGLEPGRLRLTTPACHSPKVSLEPKETHTANPHFKATITQTCTRLSNSYTTIGDVFKHLGYQTAFMGKWHLGRLPYVPDNQGFDTVIGGREHPGPPGGFFAPWSCNTLPPVPAGAHICDVLTDEAVKYVTEHKEDPFMLCLWYYDVHAPFQAKKELTEKYAAKLTDDHVQRSALMAGMVETLDTNVGRFLAQLTELGLDENTIVVLTSDNGGNMYNCPRGQVATNNYPLRAGKGNNYEGGVRVPLIVRAPGVTEANTVSHVVTSTVDHYVSLLELVGVDVPTTLQTDGYSYVPALKGEEYDRAPVYSAFCHRVPKTGNLPNISMRDKEWKLYRMYFDGPNETHRYELYNLAEDISETNNLAGEKPEIVESMVKMLDDHIEEAGYLESQLNKRYAGNSVGIWWGYEGTELSMVDNALHIKVTADSAYIETDMCPAFDGTEFVFTFDMKSTASGAGKIAWREDKKLPFSSAYEKTFEVTHDGQWHHYRVPMTFKKFINFRFMPCAHAGEVDFKNLVMETVDGHKLRDWNMNFTSLR